LGHGSGVQPIVGRMNAQKIIDALDAAGFDVVEKARPT
jgi:hypothetical protein